MLLFGEKTGDLVTGVAHLGAGVCIGLGALGPGLGCALPAVSACHGIAKQPKNADVLTMNMLIAQAVSQTTVIFALTVSLILMNVEFSNNWLTISCVIAAALGTGFGGIGPGLGEGYIGYVANQKIGEDASQLNIMTRMMLIAQAITETTGIYALVISLILLFVIA